jgi:hypothetical protein
MNRNMVYPGAIPLDTDVLTLQNNVMSALGYLAQATLGTNTVVDGLACTPQTVANMTVNIAPGSILSLTTVDATAFGSLPSDTTDPLVKIGINPSSVVSNSFGLISSPGTSGKSINYLIQASFQESDGTPVVLPYYNSANPAVPYSGPANAGTPQNTQRLQTVNLALKAGTAANTGTQVTPTPDSGYVGLWVVTVAYAQTTIVAGNISRYSATALANEQAGTGTRAGRLLNMRYFTSSTTYVPTPGTNSVLFEYVGGGGGGGGAAATGAGQSSAGCGGGAGGFGRKFVTSGFSGIALTIGAAGTASAGATGGTGGTTSVGALCSATGGVGGPAGAAAANTTNSLFGSANGGTSTGGDFNGAGYGGQSGFYALVPVSGKGGDSEFGAGGPFTSGTSSGAAGLGRGAGGAGGCLVASNGSPASGGVGVAGMIVAWEYS